MFTFTSYAEFSAVTLREIPRHLLGMKIKIEKCLFIVRMQNGIIYLKPERC